MKPNVQPTMNETSRFMQKHIHIFTSELQELVKIPSISTDKKAISRCAHHLAEEMERTGILTEIRNLPKENPVVLGRVDSRRDSQTLLVYGHYDVHPVEKLKDWEVSPFGAEISGGRLYGRGSADNIRGYTTRYSPVNCGSMVGLPE